jgi:hypothetical protein
MDSGFEMNEEMVDFLESNPELDVQVTIIELYAEKLLVKNHLMTDYFT